MQYRQLTLASIVLAFLPAVTPWRVEFYTSGCPGDNVEMPVGETAGSPDDELWCIVTNTAHNVYATAIEADNMQVTLFSDMLCNDVVYEGIGDGCSVIPADTVVQAVRVLPK
ncbi:hypothetical protein F4780DRAFT_779698 [Xylariomycetidae sp. FL0641]|nr:hypothetical protein F4780DRAFT_779698 [Xylariomycetidae sp. FL0641]